MMIHQLVITSTLSQAELSQDRAHSHHAERLPTPQKDPFLTHANCQLLRQAVFWQGEGEEVLHFEGHRRDGVDVQSCL